ncbi:MAG TPA: hypothetical protein VIA62_24040 [Thermoanaerobaculia bacterium]|jgi:phage replication-related protein YjqB (UPF0714/DUF867 family)|nr:hypothetical protein [Thermoanaerobaculia bacterium]
MLWFLALLGALTFIAPAGAQACTPFADATGVGVSLITQPFPYASLVQTSGQAPAALPDPADEIVNREHAYISSSLAGKLGITAVSLDWSGPNPQIRIWIEQPATFANWKSGTNSRNRSSSAVFTVVGVIGDAADRIWIYKKRNTSDRDSGEYKLFAADTNNSGTRIYTSQSFPDADADGILDGVSASAFRTPTSWRQITQNGVTTSMTSYCEPDAAGSLKEYGVNAADDRVAALAPHGGATESGTSDQLTPFVTTLNAAPYSVPVSTWDVQGKWEDDQTAKRWHATATTISEASSPALQAVLNQPQFNAAAGRAFRFVVAFHGFSAQTSGAIEVSLGGRAAQSTKCLAVHYIQDALVAANLDRHEIAFIIHDPVAGILDVPDKNNHTVSRRDLAGTDTSNIINRLAADGGIQLEQSKAVRESLKLSNAIATGTAKALGELINGTAPASTCGSL